MLSRTKLLMLIVAVLAVSQALAMAKGSPAGKEPANGPSSGAEAASPANVSGQRVVVHLSRFSENLHAPAMALDVASSLLRQGARVTLLLDLEGVRLADAKTPGDAILGQGEGIQARLKRFTDLGGAVLVCPHCATFAGVTEASLRPGTRIAKENEIARLLLDAHKVISY